MNKNYFFAFLLVLILMVSCGKEMGKPSWNTELLTPLLQSSLSINNLITDTLLKSNADNSLKIIYKYDFYNFSTQDLVTIPDTLVSYTYSMPITYVYKPGEILIDKTDESNYQLGDVALSKVVLKSELLKFYIENPIKEKIDILYKIPSATLGGVPFQLSFSIPAASATSPGVFDSTFSLADYTVDLTGINHDKVNTIVTQLTAKISPQGHDVAVFPSDTIVFKNGTNKVIPKYVKGYFGKRAFTIGPVQGLFSCFNHVLEGKLLLEDLTMNLIFENSIGADIKLFIDNINSENSKNNYFVALNSSVIADSIVINRATENYIGGMVLPSTTILKMDKSNSNIKQVIENLPDKLGYALHVFTNPYGNTAGSEGFIYADKGIKASLEMEIPLSLVANELTLIDTADINLENINKDNKISNATLTLFANNGFPFEAQIQVYLLDKNKIIIDSLFNSQGVISEASLDAGNKVVSKNLSQLNILLSESKFEHLRETKHLFMKARFNTSSSAGYKKIYNYYTMDVKIAGNFNYLIKK